MNQSIVYIQPIFCPSKELFEVNLSSLTSLLEYLKDNPYPLDIILGGWAINDDYWNKILVVVEEIKKFSFVNISEVRRFKHNYGKSYVINKIFSTYHKNNKKTKYILTFDSDIQIDKCESNIFMRMIEASERLEKENKRPFGCLALNLKPNQHNNIYTKDRFLKYKYEGIDEELIWDSVYFGGFNGGALFISTKAWLKAGGYKHYNQTYCPEDAFFYLCLNNLNFSFAIFKSLYVIHPDNVSDEYAKWKTYVMNRKYIIFDKFDKNEFMANVKESEKFWRNLNGKN